MKRLSYLVLIAIFSVTFSGCSVLKDIQLDDVVGALGNASGGGGLSNTDIISGLKEALTVGAINSVLKTNKTDGFLKNQLIKIALPPEAQKVANFVEKNLGNVGKTLVAEFVTKLNRSAEDASIKAKPIFTNAVKTMTITDGLNILKGGNNAATEYLRAKTFDSLVKSFRPGVVQSLNKVKLQDSWAKVASLYNKIPGKTPVNIDLASYVTENTTNGLFKMISKEEEKIRLDPVARVSDILKKVFGSLDKK